jgi:hypothetical protein
MTFSWDELAWSAVAAADILSLESAMVSVVACGGNRTSIGESSMFVCQLDMFRNTRWRCYPESSVPCGVRQAEMRLLGRGSREGHGKKGSKKFDSPANLEEGVAVKISSGVSEGLSPALNQKRTSSRNVAP